MRVLQVFEPPDGGVAEHVARLTQGLAERGHHVEVAGPPSARIRPDLPATATYHPVAFTRSYRRPTQDLETLRSLQAVLRAHPLDLVHAHSSKAGVLVRLAARSAKVPCVYTPHCFPFIGDVSRLRQVFTAAVERMLAPLAARTICVSRDERAEALARHVGRPHRLQVIHNGVDPCPQVEPDSGLRHFAGDLPLVGAVAVHRRQKGLEGLLVAVPEVLARRPDVRFAIVGDGPLLPCHRELARELGLGEAVTFHPFVPPPARYLRALDLFVLPSRWEAFPISVLEAMACGTPVLATDVGGTAEALERGAGVLVPSGDQAALVAEIVRLVDSPDTRAELASEARSRVVADFGSERMVDEIAALYEQVVATDRTGSAAVPPVPS